MRSESEGVSKTNSVEESRPGYPGGSELEAPPSWRIVKAGEEGSLVREFAEPMITLMSKLVKLEMASIEKKLKKG